MSDIILLDINITDSLQPISTIYLLSLKDRQNRCLSPGYIEGQFILRLEPKSKNQQIN